ncbi:MAG: ABC transporter ATP-binding protein [Acidimicrobiia bacterium]
MSASLPTADRAATVRVVRALLRPRRLVLAGAAGLFVARAGAGLVGPAVLGRIVDLVNAGAPPGAITAPAVVLLCAAMAEGILAWAGPAAAASAAEPALADLRERVVEHGLLVPLGELERAGTGDLVARVDGDIAAASRAMSEAVPELVESGLTIALTVVGLTVLDWRLGLAGLCAAPVQWHTVRWYVPRAIPLYARERIAAGARSQQLFETIGSAATVRSMGIQDRHERLVDDASGAARQLAVAASFLRTRFYGRLNVAEVTGLSAILGTGFVLVGRGAVTVGAVTAAVLYFVRIFDPVNVLLSLVDDVLVAGAALARLVGVTQLTAAGPGQGSSPDFPGEVRCTGASFAYEAGHTVLHDIDLTVAPGEQVAIVGASGAGKSTLAKLIAAVHEPTTGQVTVGGLPAGEAGDIGGHRPVVLVTQEVHVFAGPLREDLWLAALGASEQELEAALDRVGAIGWARALPDGLATRVGDGGHPLSATQSQQLALARLVLAGPAVAVLDEATAEAGSAGARVLEAAAAAALSGRSAVVVAHRLTQAARADRIVVLDGGRVVETGSHEGLVAAAGHYSALWSAWSRPRQ